MKQPDANLNNSVDPLVWYELENGHYVQKRGRDKYPPGAYAFINGLYVRTSRVDPSWERLTAMAERRDAPDVQTKEPSPAGDTSAH